MLIAKKTMKTLSKQISTLLFEHDCVIVPGLGGFITNYKPATIHPHHHTFYPPSKQVTFNTALTGNDGVLTSALAMTLNVDFNEAKRIIDHKVHSIRVSLLKGQKVEFEEIGFLVANRENHIEFHSYNKINYLGEAYGLTRFDFNPVNRTNSNSVINKPVVRQTMRWAAVLVPIAAVALWATLNTGTVNKLYQDYASLVPSAREVSSTPSAPAKNTITANPAVKTTTPETTNVSGTHSPVSETAESAGTSIGNSASSDATITSESRNIKAINVTGSYHIIAGAFSVPENAAKLVEQLKSEGYNATVIGQNRRKLHMVSIGSFSDRTTAGMRMSELHRKGFPSAWLLEKTN